MGRKLGQNERIKLARIAAYLHHSELVSLDDIAERVDVDVRTLYRWKRDSVIWAETRRSIEDNGDLPHPPPPGLEAYRA